MPEEKQRYVDPNSGAAPQPGGFANAPVADVHDPDPEDANPELGGDSGEPGPEEQGQDPNPAGDDTQETQDPNAEPVVQQAQGEEPGETEKGAAGEREAAEEGEGETQAVETDGGNPRSPESTEEPTPGEGEGEPEEPSAENLRSPEVTEEPAAATEPTVESTQDASDEVSDTELYAEVLSGNVDEVNDYIKNHPDERDAVIAAERQGQSRKGIVGE